MMKHRFFLPLLLLPFLLISACHRSLVERSDAVVGSYSNSTPISCTGADIDISLLPDGRYSVQGIATWCPDEEGIERGAVSIGELDYVAPLVDSVLRYEDVEMGYVVEVKVVRDGLEVVEEGEVGYHGLNVTFEGRYERTDGEGERE